MFIKLINTPLPDNFILMILVNGINDVNHRL
jgi:hypothetical protein